MYKVLIIDDEPIIRKGLKNIINWKQMGCEVVGEAIDGTAGISLVNKEMPDIIITDIKMPEMDGLEMIRHIREQIPNCKIIILTGYRDFNYIQEAIKLGAFDFLLKPSKIEELNAVLHRAVKELSFQKDKEEEINKLRKLFEQNVPILRENLLYDIIYGINTDEKDILEKMVLFNMRIGRFICVVVESDIEEDSNLSQYDIHLYQFGIINSFEESFSDGFKILRISLNNKQIAFIILSINDEIINYESISDKCTNILDIIKNCFGFTVTVAISDEGIGPMALIKKYGICRDALKFKFYIGDNSIISYKDLNSFYKYEDYSPLEKNQELLLEGIKTGNESVVKKELAEIFLFMKGKESNIEYVKNFYQKVITTINNIRMSVIVTDIDKPIENKELNSLYKFMKKCDNIKELNDILEEIAIRITLRVNLLNNKKIKLALQKALDYIHENYTEQITLSQVAQQIYLSSFYLSRLFKKEMGKNFVDYLNEIRVEKAKELLKDIKYKSYEIAEMVGIPDAHYFSKLFKKYVGMAPTEYRDSHII